MSPAGSRWQLEFPPEVVAERAQAVWLERFPDDYGMWDLGEALWMLGDALVATDPEAASRAATPSLLLR